MEPNDRSSGRVVFDDRGNAIWEWSVSTGRFTSTVATARLKKLEHPELSLIEDDASTAASRAPPPAAAPETTLRPRRPGAGYCPYDSGIPPARPVAKSGSAAAPKKKDLRRLGEFFVLRKQAARNKDDKT